MAQMKEVFVTCGSPNLWGHTSPRTRTWHFSGFTVLMVLLNNGYIHGIVLSWKISSLGALVVGPCSPHLQSKRSVLAAHHTHLGNFYTKKPTSWSTLGSWMRIPGGGDHHCFRKKRTRGFECAAECENPWYRWSLSSFVIPSHPSGMAQWF
jgi:hypothetical protein